MPSFVHLSDIHFGPRHDAHLADVIVSEINGLNPDIVVLSGDFTLRGRIHEYETAREFLKRIEKPRLMIPGNHDQPLFEPVERLTQPFARYEQYICSSTDTTLECAGLYILGLNDNRRILPGGFWSGKQRAWLAAELSKAPGGATRIVVSHHHFLWGGKWRPAGFWYPQRAFEWLARNGVEMLLNGHTHVPVAVQTPQGLVVAGAGTAASTRIRDGWGNSYNLVRVDDEQITISVRQYEERSDAFLQAKSYQFPRRLGG